MGYTTIVAGTTITASWGNADVRDQVVVPFASTSARDSAITSPVVGMVEYLKTNGVDEGLTTRTTAATWRKPWNLPWGILSYTAITASATSITTAERTVVGTVPTTVANRRVKYTTGTSGVLSTVGANDSAEQRIYRASTQIMAATAFSQTAGFAAIFAPATCYDIPGASSSNSIEFRFIRTLGSGSWTVAAGATAPAFICVEDVGPSGSPA